MADYEVGYKKPPRHSQFKPGNRANPHGRGKRKLRTEAEIVNEAAQLARLRRLRFTLMN